jgi:hypothetical protein
MDGTYTVINKVSVSLKIEVLAIQIPTVTLPLFIMPSDYCVVLLWQALEYSHEVRPSAALGGEL